MAIKVPSEQVSSICRGRVNFLEIRDDITWLENGKIYWNVSESWNGFIGIMEYKYVIGLIHGKIFTRNMLRTVKCIINYRREGTRYNDSLIKYLNLYIKGRDFIESENRYKGVIEAWRRGAKRWEEPKKEFQDISDHIFIAMKMRERGVKYLLYQATL